VVGRWAWRWAEGTIRRSVERREGGGPPTLRSKGGNKYHAKLLLLTLEETKDGHPHRCGEAKLNLAAQPPPRGVSRGGWATGTVHGSGTCGWQDPHVRSTHRGELSANPSPLLPTRKGRKGHWPSVRTTPTPTQPHG